MTNTSRGQTDYQDKKESRIDSLRTRAENAETKSDDHFNAARAISDMIPFGQPILVGHHSEKGHRRDNDRIASNMDKAVESSKKADHLNQRATAKENNTAISQDDPEAVVKLRAKLEGLEKYQEQMKQGNKIYRSKKLTDEQKIEQLTGLGMSVDAASEVLKPDFDGRAGFPHYMLSNNNATIKSVKKRIATMEAIDSLNFETVTINDIKIVDDKDDNRIKMYFPGIPSEIIRDRLKSGGFRWSRKNGAWQAYRKTWNYENAKFTAGMSGS